MSNLKETIRESFIQYSGAVLQSRALVDSRDCLKPSARQIFYCLYTDKFLPSKPFKKTLKAIGSVARMYIHGDSSAEGIIMRASQEWCFRYPLIEVQGNNGSLAMSGNYAAPRYTEARLSHLGEHLFKDIEKDTITEWRDNYDDTEQYPMVLPSKGFFNLVNGTLGIGIGMSSSIPSFNLREVNNALIKLLKNPDASFDELYCAPDFPTGAVLLNESEVKESLKNGTGSSCRLRSVINFDDKERCFIVTEIPFGVYTNTICSELNEIMDSAENPGIDRFNDLTGKTALIKIYLKKGADSAAVLNYLYKHTSLQSFYSINMTMLEDGRYPRVYGWKELLNEHINHEKTVYSRAFEYDLNKIRERISILDGYIIACAHIEEVVEMIKKSKTKGEAAEKLMAAYELNEAQVNAILKLTLSRIASLEVQKFIDEREEKKKEAERIEDILNSEVLFNAEIEKGLKEVADRFGDARRTKILDICKETTEIKEKVIYYGATGKAYLSMPKNDTVLAQGIAGNTFLGITRKGIVYRTNEVPARSKGVFKLAEDDSLIAVLEEIPNGYLTIVDSEKHFRCKAVSTLNEKKTTLTLENLTFAGISKEKTTKATYKEILKLK